MTEATTQPDATQTTEPQQQQTDQFSWKGQLSSDVQNSPLVQKFEDTKEGLGKAVESHLQLEKLLGHEKIPIPKDANDAAGWDRYKKAMKVPDSPKGYQLPDVQMPKALEGQFNKDQFAEVMHKNMASPEQAKNFWLAHTELAKQSYNKAMESYQHSIDDTINKLRGEWMDAYDTNVELGQRVINQFSGDQETNDYITSMLSQDPRGIKFLYEIGKQFAENKVGDFQVKKYSMSPADAQEELEKIYKDPEHPYNSEKATQKEHAEAVEYVNRLLGVIQKAKQPA